MFLYFVNQSLFEITHFIIVYTSDLGKSPPLPVKIRLERKRFCQNRTQQLITVTLKLSTLKVK
jgi:hypothetical protein